MARVYFVLGGRGLVESSVWALLLESCRLVVLVRELSLEKLRQGAFTFAHSFEDSRSNRFL